ncbi:MAG: hypothetical protein DSM106950_21500 [Stigonema ocellatum SAG 48.90 = DSM 106950]|nr:hypothetical protein [Stigonema ocellatum SAG 48.90 = DSM 106950]
MSNGRIRIENQDMPYSQFTTIGKVKQAFGIKTVEGKRFLPEVEPIAPSETLLNYLEKDIAGGDRRKYRKSEIRGNHCSYFSGSPQYSPQTGQPVFR